MEKLKINKKVVEQTKTIHVTNDIIVPDIKPDIISIVTTNGVPYIYKQENEKNRVKVDGNIDSYIVYLSVDGDTRSIQTTLNFNDILENNDIKENSYVRYKIELETLNARVLNERKITLSATISINYTISEIQEIEIKDDFLRDIPELQKQEESLKIKSLVGINTAKASIKEDINIDNLDEIAEILKVDVEITKSEEKISYNKVLAKVEFNIDIVYMTEDSRIGNVKNMFPIMSFVDIENIKEEDITVFEYNIKNMLIKLNNKDNHSITIQIDFEIYCEVYEEKEMVILKDAYSLIKDLDILYKALDVEENKAEEDYIEIVDSVKIEDIKRIVSVEKRKISILKKDRFNIEGEVNLVLYYETTDRLGLSCKEIKLPFVTKSKIQENCIFELNNIEMNLNNENVNFSIKILIRSNFNTNNSINVIDDIKVKNDIACDDYGVVVYVVKKNDTIWKIGKTFKVTVDSLKKVNDIEDVQKINPGDKLYILK